jgi:Eco47II restriction endonuclease
MSNQYLSYISDQDLMRCVGNLHNSYLLAAKKIDLKDFYGNKVDVIKLIFDSKFNDLSDEQLLRNEIARQVDKSNNNAIGTFHEEVLGSIEGYEKGKLDGFDIKATNNTLFADIKNKHNTMNSSSAEALFQKLKGFADGHKSANCYWVQIWAKTSFNEKWLAIINGKEYSHSRVYKISGDRFYTLLSGSQTALFDLYDCLPAVISTYLKTNPQAKKKTQTVIDELKAKQSGSNRNLFDQISYDNFHYYLGFSEL